MKIASMKDKAVAAAVRAGEPGYVYVGRAMPRQGLKGSRLGNWLKVGRDGTLAEVLADYERDVRYYVHYRGLDSGDRENRVEITSALDALTGTETLVCWCASCTRDPYPDPENHADGCHGDIVWKVWAERNAP